MLQVLAGLLRGPALARSGGDHFPALSNEARDDFVGGAGQDGNREAVHQRVHDGVEAAHQAASSITALSLATTARAAHVTRKLHALAGITEMVAVRASVECCEV